MSTWISRPADKPSARWHLEGLLPRTELAFTACGLSWAPTDTDTIERTSDLDHIRGALRCEACDAIYVRQVTQS